MLSTTYMPEIKFQSVIFVEPGIFRKQREGEPDPDLAQLVEKREDIWSSYEEALKSFNTSRAFRNWNPRVREIYAVRIYIDCAQSTI